MSHFSYSSCCTIEEHISNLEDVYAQCLKDNMDHETLTEIWNHVKKLRKMNNDNKVAEAHKKRHNLNSVLEEIKKDRLIPGIQDFLNEYSSHSMNTIKH